MAFSETNGCSTVCIVSFSALSPCLSLPSLIVRENTPRPHPAMCLLPLSFYLSLSVAHSAPPLASLCAYSGSRPAHMSAAAHAVITPPGWISRTGARVGPPVSHIDELPLSGSQPAAVASRRLNCDLSGVGRTIAPGPRKDVSCCWTRMLGSAQTPTRASSVAV